ncbi:hypothetical protein ACFYXS_29065 [Streptomyces sp. NPDC002574]|uniref:hypothetical protein n=1 Tax=Streptomyces sp. NPDC002574 TaxID=3364652 RepID=UPI0036B086D0
MTEAGAVQVTPEVIAQAAPEAASGPEGPQPMGVVVEATGNTEVDGVLVRLEDADVLPTEDHIEVYEDVHRGLRDALTRLDDNRS